MKDIYLIRSVDIHIKFAIINVKVKLLSNGNFCLSQYNYILDST